MRIFVLGSVVQIALLAGILYYFIGQNYRIIVKFAVVEPEVSAILYRELRTLIGILLSVFTVYLLGISYLGWSFSHRVGGAIYALKRTINQINEGEDVQLKLRKNDEFQEMADDFNLMVKNLKAGNAVKGRVG